MQQAELDFEWLLLQLDPEMEAGAGILGKVR
jgi:hypothetical protein